MGYYTKVLSAQLENAEVVYQAWLDEAKPFKVATQSSVLLPHQSGQQDRVMLIITYLTLKDLK